MRPWHYWLAFLVCLAVVLAAMGWVSATALRLDQSQAESQRKSAYEEDVRLALWRMETAIAPLLARESMRPYSVYSPFYAADQTFSRSLQKDGARDILVPSPLLAEDSRHVLLHFQLDAAARFTSPQAPRAKMRDVSVATYNNAAMIEQAETRLAQLQKTINGRDLFAAVSGDDLDARRIISREVIRTVTVTAAPPQRLAGALPPPPPRHEEQASQVAETAPSAQVAHAAGITQTIQPAPQQAANAPLTLESARRGFASQSVNSSMDREELRNVTEWQMRSQQQADVQNIAPLRSQRAVVVGTAGAKAAKAAISTEQKEVHGSAAATKVPALLPPESGKTREETQEETLQTEVREGLMKPLWVGDVLLLARRVVINGQEYVQGCWLDWPSLRRQLLDQIRDLFPDARLEAVRTVPTRTDAGRILAGLPVRLIPGRMAGLPAEAMTPVRFSLIIAWCCVLLGATAVGLLMAGAVSLSERRGAFVSAVTHELRTPLTTFRMYAEMLAEGMVTDESKRHHYLQTLCAEGNRLSHLVENVLSYARLERGRRGGHMDVIAIGDLMTRTMDRLRQRAEQAGMAVVWEPDDAMAGAEVRTDLSAVEQILLNLVDNACKYASYGEDKRIHIEAGKAGRYVTLSVRDHGLGITAEDGRRLFRPFSKSAKHAAESAPGVGLGLALSRRLARQMGGDLRLLRPDGLGACFGLFLPCR